MAIRPCLNQTLTLCMQSTAESLNCRKRANYSLSASCIAPEPDKSWQIRGADLLLRSTPDPFFSPRFALRTSFYFAAEPQIEFLAITDPVEKIEHTYLDGVMYSTALQIIKYVHYYLC